MALTETRPETASAPVPDAPPARTQPTAVERVVASGDHKTIGRVFVGASVLFMASDLILAALVNLHAASGDSILESSVANRMLLNHPIGLMFCGALPLFLGLGIYLVPLQVGSPTVAFPRAAALSLWGWLGGTVLFCVAFAVKGSYGGSSLSMTRLGHVSFGLLIVSLLVGVVCVMTTVVSHRVAGMTIDRVPFFSFSMLVAGALWLTTLPAALAIIAMWEVRRPTALEFSDLDAGPYPALEWLFHQPAVYLAAIPLLGVLADVAVAAGGQRNRAYAATQGAIVAFGALSFGAWAQTDASRNTLLWVVSAVAVALPVLVVMATSLDAVARGSRAVTPAMALVFIAALTLLFATLVGLFLGVNTAGSNDLASVGVGGFGKAGPGLAVGQFYLVMAAVFVGGIGALFHWGSRIWAGGLNRGAALAVAPLAAVGGLAFGLGHAIMGLARPTASTSEKLAAVSGVGALLLAVVGVGVVAAMAEAAMGRSRAPEPDSRDGAGGGTLEWATASPPVVGNFSGPIPDVESPYPLLDAATASEQGAN